MTPSPVRLTPVLLAFLTPLLILVGCGGGGGTSTGVQSAKTTGKTTYGYFRKSNGATGAGSNTSVNMSSPRTGHSATLLADGRVLVAGGNTTTINNPNFTTYNSAELFDPTTELFSMVPSTMSVARTEQCAVTMPDKRVLMISGSGNFFSSPPDFSTGRYFRPGDEQFLVAACCRISTAAHRELW